MASSPENDGFDSDSGLSQEALDILMAGAGMGEQNEEQVSSARQAAQMGQTSGIDNAAAVSDTLEDDGLSQEALTALLASAGLEGDISEQTPSHSAPVMPSVVDLPSFDPPPGTFFAGEMPSADPPGMSRVRDIPLDVTVELGRTRLLIRDILDLSAGSIIELDKIAGEPVDLFANGMLVARGEVIVIDDNFGVRVTEIITATERTHTKEANALAA